MVAFELVQATDVRVSVRFEHTLPLQIDDHGFNDVSEQAALYEIGADRGLCAASRDEDPRVGQEQRWA
jgi:hypothetical protein